MKLSFIQPVVQQIAQTIGSVLELDTEIVDNELVILGGTGKYTQEIGSYEENGLTNGPYLYARILREGKPSIVEDTSENEYDPDSRNGNPEEMAEICCPIRKDEQILGIIALVAFTPEQKIRLLEKKAEYMTFIQRMAFLLASLASEKNAREKATITTIELETILSELEQGVILVDDRGQIKYVNNAAITLIKDNNETDIIGKNVTDLWPFSPIMRVLDSNKDYVEYVEITGLNRQLILSARPFHWSGKIIGAVVYLEEYNISDGSLISTTEGNLYSFNSIIGCSEIINQLKEKAKKASKSNSTILLTGESGTGKGLFAKAIHNASPRRNKPFVQINCGAIPENLLESELFGYEGGSFTGARKEGKPGKFEHANGGTIFLDEIGEMLPYLQIKLLHVLENKFLERIGGNKPIKLDVRVIAATNRNLEEMIAIGEFREDLYFRLSVIPLQIPPLRKRKEDLHSLLKHFLQKQCKELDRTIRGLSPEALYAFQHYNWPGNARELENAIAYCVNMETDEFIQPENLPEFLKPEKNRISISSLRNSLQEQERSILLAYIEGQSKYKTKTELARALKISRTTLYRKLKKLGIQ
ncbi:MAG: sigma 54-interacting transcriptional regulator [Bacillota bacterium]|nr:sigma 54-interacting transcriptional regulator [Bacillota bacterium]